MVQYNRRQFLQGAAGAVALIDVAASCAGRRQQSNSRGHDRTQRARQQSHRRLSDRTSSRCAIAIAACSASGPASSSVSRVARWIRSSTTASCLDRKDIDAISIATPNHTHALIAIAAAEAGKHVYCEKPVSQCLWEGRQIVNAARRYDRLIQCGTQARSSACNQQARRVRSQRQARQDQVRGRHLLQAAAEHRQARQAAGDSERRRLRPVVRSGGEGRSVSAEFALRLALGFQHRLRRHRQSGPASDGRGPLVPGRAAARAAGDQRGRAAGLRGRRQHAEFADRAARLCGGAADFRDARLAEVEGGPEPLGRFDG